MPEYTITLNEAEAKAMAYVAYSPEDWIQHAASERARIAMEEIFEIETRRMLADPSVKSIPADREAVVLAAELKSAKERTDEAEAAMAEGPPVDTV